MSFMFVGVTMQIILLNGIDSPPFRIRTYLVYGINSNRLSYLRKYGKWIFSKNIYCFDEVGTAIATFKED